MADKIAVEGLAEFSRALKKLDADLPKLIRVTNNEAANLLINKTRQKMPSRSGKAQNSLKARSTRVSARVSIGGPKAPYVPWLDFGGKTGRNKSVIRPFYKDGRYLYPTLGEIKDELAEVQYKGMKDIARQAGLDVK